MTWLLALEFTKVLAAPLAAIIGVAMTAALALNNFRRQKRVERQLDWYERMHRAIVHAKSQNALVASELQATDLSRLAEAGAANVQVQLNLLLVAGEAALYAHRGAFKTVWRLRKGLEVITEQWEHDPLAEQKFHLIAQLLEESSVHLAAEMRSDIGLPPLTSLDTDKLYPRQNERVAAPTKPSTLPSPSRHAND